MPINTFWFVMLAAGLAGLVTTIGIYVINKYVRWGKNKVIYFISFAAGVLIAVSFLHIVPESFEMNKLAPIFLLVGFLFFHLLSKLLNRFTCDKPACRKYKFGLIPLLGIGFHSFVDGIIYSVTFKVSIFTGALAAIGMVLHEFPEGIITFLFLIKAGFNKKKSLFYAFLAAAISTPLGALVSYPLINLLKDQVLGILLSLSAGVLLYVGATHLLPKVEEEHQKPVFWALAAGVFVAVLIVLMH
jgi:zinc transporter ZupT